MIEPGTVRMRYPGGDPENGPAYKQRWTGEQWECAEHKWVCYPIDEKGIELIEECEKCGTPKPEFWPDNGFHPG